MCLQIVPDGNLNRITAGRRMAPMGHSPLGPLPLSMASPSPARRNLVAWRTNVKELLLNLWSNDEGQDIAEYAVMLAVILVIVVGTIRLIGSNANNVFSQTASAIGS